MDELSHSTTFLSERDHDAPLRVALLRRGDPSLPLDLGPRFEPLLQAFSALGAEARAVPFAESALDAVRAQLLGCDGVMIWIDPIDDGRDRSALDPLLRDVAGHGVWVSAHPDVILKMGVKAVLWRTRKLGWGADTRLYETAAEFREGFPKSVVEAGPRVLKQNRGNGGQGVWKVTAQGVFDDGALRVELIPARSDHAQSGVRLSDFITECEAFIAPDRPLIDQAFQPRVADGMVRCYSSQGQVIGFAEQAPRSHELAAADPTVVTFGMASAKRMHDETAPAFQGLRRSMEQDWIPGLQRVLDIETSDLPALWDADFLYGPKTAAGDDTFVLCEINISSVSPFPPTAAAAIARTAVTAAQAARDRWSGRWRR
jgi:hypothetical protein